MDLYNSHLKSLPHSVGVRDRVRGPPLVDVHVNNSGIARAVTVHRNPHPHDVHRRWRARPVPSAVARISEIRVDKHVLIVPVHVHIPCETVDVIRFRVSFRLCDREI